MQLGQIGFLTVVSQVSLTKKPPQKNKKKETNQTSWSYRSSGFAIRECRIHLDSNQMLTRGLNMQEGSQSQSLEIGTQRSSLIGSRPKWDAQRATNGRRGGGNGMLIASLLFLPQWTTHILPGHVNLGNEPQLHWYFHIFLSSIYAWIHFTFLSSI